VDILVENGKGSIEKIYPRTSYLIRPTVANIDVLVIVVAAAEPEPNILLIDKLLVNSENVGIKPVILINKTDVKSGKELKEIYEKAGYPVVLTCAKEKDIKKEILPYIKDKTSAFAGLSGVGKSTILNSITDTNQETGEISDRIKRGKHTTRHVELLELPEGGYVLDTPGFSSFELNTIKADELYKYFPEMRDFTDMCRFKGCVHINEPDCVVKEKVASGEIAKSRYESYTELFGELKKIKEWEK
jgi:ribosome biogenesis GTPase